MLYIMIYKKHPSGISEDQNKFLIYIPHISEVFILRSSLTDSPNPWNFLSDKSHNGAFGYIN